MSLSKHHSHAIPVWPNGLFKLPKLEIQNHAPLHVILQFDSFYFSSFLSVCYPFKDEENMQDTKRWDRSHKPQSSVVDTYRQDSFTK